MKIQNKTHWRTDHLRAFITRIAERELDPEKRKRVRVDIEYTKGYGGGSSGCAWSNQATVRIARNNPDKIDFAHVIAHEFAHCRGMQHKDGMGTSPRYGRAGNWREIYAWAETLPLEADPKRIDFRCAKRLPPKAGGWRMVVCGARARVQVGEIYLCRKHLPAVTTTPVAEIPRPLVVRATPDQKRAAIETQIARWTTKRKRAETFLRKWTRRLRAFDARTRRAAVRPPTPVDSLPE